MAKRKPKEQHEYIFKGKLELDNVDFYITASSEEEAREIAKSGTWDSWDVQGASSINWTIDADSGESNE